LLVIFPAISYPNVITQHNVELDWQSMFIMYVWLWSKRNCNWNI